MKRFCFDEKTELLTSEGWASISSIGSLPIATLSKQDGSLRFQKPTDYIESKYSGPMINIQSRSLDALVTPNHRMFVATWRDRSKWGFVSADKLDKQHSVMTAAPCLLASQWKSPFDEQPYLVEEDWAELIGWFCAEGYTLSRQDSLLVGISQTPRGHMDELNKLLQKLPWDFKYNRGSNSFTVYHGGLWAFFKPCGDSYEKSLPREVFNMSFGAKERCLYGLVMGDGHISKRDGHILYSTVSYQLAQDVCELMAHLNIASTLTFEQARISYLKNGKSIKSSGLYRVYGRKTNRAHMRSADGKAKFSTLDYSGIVRCVTVPDGILLARRNTKPIFTGNSWDEWARYSSDQRDPKAKPQDLHSDFPKLLGYLANSGVTYAGLKMGAQVLKRAGRRGA